MHFGHHTGFEKNFNTAEQREYEISRTFRGKIEFFMNFAGVSLSLNFPAYNHVLV